VREEHLIVARTARYATLGAAGPGLRQVLVACHGYGQLAGRFIRHLAPLDDGTRLVVAPEALSRFYLDEPGSAPATERRVGACWMTREDRLHEIDDYVRYLDAVYAHVLAGVDRDAVEVCALGFSQGVATASRWALRGAARVDGLVLWAGLLPPELDLATERERLERMRLTIVVGTSDHFATRDTIAAEEARLRAAGVRYRLVRYDGGHRLHEATLREVAAHI
jgi:predicted esterase